MATVAVVCEAPADFQTIVALAERVILDVHRRRESSPWLDEDTITHAVEWRVYDPAPSFLRWRIDVDAQARRLELVPRFRREPDLQPYSHAGLKALQVLTAAPGLDGAILVVDGDDQPQRLAGLEQARRYHQSVVGQSVLLVAVGMPVTKRECWHLCGFQSESEAERVASDRLRSELGGEPWLRTHELTAAHDGDLRSAKRVLSALCGDDCERELRCLHAPLELLRERGEHNGLAVFLAEIETHIVPLVLR